MRRIGAVFQPSFPPERLRSAVQAADRAGVHEVWLWEDCFRESGFATAAAALAWTERLRIGIGVAPMPLRNVALTAMEIATIERLFPGRLIMGIGHGVQSGMGQVGARVASPLTLLREYAPALRRLLAGEDVSMQGRYVQLDGVRLDWPPAVPVPVLAAGEGPKTLRLTGEVADGTVFTSGTSAQLLRSALELVREGRAASDREGTGEVVVYLLTAFGGADAEASMTVELGRWDRAEPVAAVGDVERVAATAAEFFHAGADAVVLQPVADEADLDGFMEQAGRVAATLL